VLPFWELVYITILYPVTDLFRISTIFSSGGWANSIVGQSWTCCDRRTRFFVIWKHFCFILSTNTRIRIDFLMRPRSSSRGCNTSASITVSRSELVCVHVLTRASWTFHLHSSRTFPRKSPRHSPGHFSPDITLPYLPSSNIPTRKNRTFFFYIPLVPASWVS